MPGEGDRCWAAGTARDGVPMHVRTDNLTGSKKPGGGKCQISVTRLLGWRLRPGSELVLQRARRSTARSVQYSALRLSGRFDPFYKTLLHILPLPAHPRFQDCLRFVKSHLLRRLQPSRDEWLLSHAVVVKTPMCAHRR